MSKRRSNIIVDTADMENLRLAFLRAAKGKSDRSEVIEFRKDLENNLTHIRQDLLSCEYEFGFYRKFVIFDPKKRTICAACFRDRVLFHAMMDVCYEKFEKFQVCHSCASRIGKGTYKAIEIAQQHARRYQWFVKLDIRHYFDSIDHAVLQNQLSRLFKDKQALTLFSKLLNTYHVEKGKGLPIGNLTSQYFANHYLAVADHYLCEKLHVGAMVRYMDDYLLFSNDKNKLMVIVSSFVSWLENSLKLLCHKPILNKVKYGVPYLGYIVYPYAIRLSQRSRRRFRSKLSNLDGWFEHGCIDEHYYRSHYIPLRAFVDKANSFKFVMAIHNEF